MWPLWASVEWLIDLQLQNSDQKLCSPCPLRFLRYLLVFMTEPPSSQFSAKNQMSVNGAHMLHILTAGKLTLLALIAPCAILRGPGKAWRTTNPQGLPLKIAAGWGRVIDNLKQAGAGTAFSNPHNLFTPGWIYLFCYPPCDFPGLVIMSSGAWLFLSCTKRRMYFFLFIFPPPLSFPYYRMKCHCLKTCCNLGIMWQSFRGIWSDPPLSQVFLEPQSPRL